MTGKGTSDKGTESEGVWRYTLRYKIEMCPGVGVSRGDLNINDTVSSLKVAKRPLKSSSEEKNLCHYVWG